MDYGQLDIINLKLYIIIISRYSRISVAVYTKRECCCSAGEHWTEGREGRGLVVFWWWWCYSGGFCCCCVLFYLFIIIIYFYMYHLSCLLLYLLTIKK